MSGGRLVGVGVGPGDPEHLTLKALRALADADRVFVPVTDSGEVGRAERIVSPHVGDGRITRLRFAMSDAAAREGNWDRAGEAIAAVVRDGGTAAFATLGDPNLYSTFTYVAQTVAALVPRASVETVPGITAMQDLAARAGVVLAEGTERVALLPFTAGAAALGEALDVFDTVVCYKGGRRLASVLDVARERGRIDAAVYGERLGLDGELVAPAAEMDGRAGPYLSAVIMPPTRGHGRGGRIE